MKECILAFLPTKHRFIVLIVLQIGIMPINRYNFFLYNAVLPSKVCLFGFSPTKCCSIVLKIVFICPPPIKQNLLGKQA